MSLLVLSLVIIPAIAACGDVATPTTTVTILPKDCRLLVNEQMPMTLNGTIPPNAVITWEADAGSVISSAPGLNALLFAPPQPTVVNITVSISSGTPSVQIPITRQCIVSSPNADPVSSVVVAPTEMVPQGSAEPVVNISASPTIVISEVMANPCGDVEVRKWNEYVELYNYGDFPVDVNGWWLADIGESGTPDQLVSWSQRHPNNLLPGALVLDSSVIPAKGFAVILSPGYTDGAYPYIMPYHIPDNTVILTAASSRSLGDDYFNIIGDGQSLDVMVLYKGGERIIQEVVSTYGSPKLDSYVTNIRDDHLDNLPRDLHECSSIERINAIGGDIFDNWREVSGGSPGEAPY